MEPRYAFILSVYKPIVCPQVKPQEFWFWLNVSRQQGSNTAQNYNIAHLSKHTQVGYLPSLYTRFFPLFLVYCSLHIQLQSLSLLFPPICPSPMGFFVLSIDRAISAPSSLSLSFTLTRGVSLQSGS